MTNLTLDERLEFEKLMTEYANASMDCVRAHQRRHDALHRVEDYINKRTASIAEAVRAHAENLNTIVTHDEVAVELPSVPTGTHCTRTARCIHYAGHSGHCYTGDAPPPISDVSGGN